MTGKPAAVAIQNKSICAKNTKTNGTGKLANVSNNDGKRWQGLD